MRPTKGTLKRTSLWFTKAQLDELAEVARRTGSNASQLIRDYVNAGLRREARKQQ
jgi:hypothetical protein